MYRQLALFPEWFDEIIAKGIVFGIPSILYARNAVRGSEKLGVLSSRFWPGLYMGLLVGGIYGFIGAGRSLFGGTQIEPAMLFSSGAFWFQFFLAMMTAWWESVFFFGFMMNALQDEYKLPEMVSVVGAVLVFLIFSCSTSYYDCWFQFAHNCSTPITRNLAGQAILFHEQKVYAITLSHALWGMVLMAWENNTHPPITATYVGASALALLFDCILSFLSIV
jgi:hypothetical protein